METTEDLTPLEQTGYNLCFGCGQENPVGLKLRFHLAKDKSSVCLVTVPENFEGPPGCVHGGIIATILDETLHKAVRAQGAVVAVTRTLEIDYRRPVPTMKPIRVEAHVTAQDGRKYWAEACILDCDGKQLATAKAIFVEIRAGHLKRAEENPPSL